MIKTFVISDDLFHGFSVILNPMLFDSIKSLLEHIKNKLKAIFVLNNLELLAQKVDNLDLHLHGAKFISDLQEKPEEDIIYICSYSHC